MFGEVTAMIDQQETPEASRERKRIFKMQADVRGNLAAAGSKLRLHHEAAYPTIKRAGTCSAGTACEMT